MEGGDQMSDLKTLKDIDGGSYKGPIDLLEGVKQEAIKWYHRSDDNKHKFILEFFNITKEDLFRYKNDKDLK